MAAETIDLDEPAWPACPGLYGPLAGCSLARTIVARIRSIDMLRLLVASLFLAACAATHDQVRDESPDPASFPESTVPLADGLSFDDHLTLRAPFDFLRDHPARAEGGLVNAVVEIPAGSCEKWEVERDGVMRWDMKDGRPRHVAYLGYPCNYGIVPRALLGQELGGDGDPLDMLVLGPSLPRGTVLAVQAIGVIRLVDRGEMDDKLIAVPVGSSLAEAATVEQLDELFPGITTILRAWFENYKGRGVLQCSGFGGEEEAEALLVSAMHSFDLAEADGAAGRNGR
jgi:inorganic pyrophosphatase